MSQADTPSVIRPCAGELQDQDEKGSVHVYCYYTGNPPSPYKGDGYQDHVEWENIPSPITGHVPDYYVNFDGQTPAQVGIPLCKNT